MEAPVLTWEVRMRALCWILVTIGLCFGGLGAAEDTTPRPGLGVKDLQALGNPPAVSGKQKKPEAVDPDKDMVLAVARSQEEQNTDEGAEQALAIYRQYVEHGGPAKREALFGIARTAARLKQWWAAWEALEASYPETLETAAVASRVSLEYEIGQAFFAYGADPVPGAMQKEDGAEVPLNGYACAAKAFAAVVYHDPRSAETAPALLYLGDCQLALGDKEGAEVAWAKLIHNRPRTLEALEARAALAKLLTGKTLNGKAWHKALAEAERQLRAAAMGVTHSPAVRRRVEDARKALAETKAAEALKRARYYLKPRTERGRNAAVYALRELIETYPETDAAQDARALLDKLGVPEREPASPSDTQTEKESDS